MEKINYLSELERETIISDKISQGYHLVEDQVYADNKWLIFKKTDSQDIVDIDKEEKAILIQNKQKELLRNMAIEELKKEGKLPQDYI